MCKLILIRGLPGSGKSTFAESLKKNDSTVIVEADQYFIDSDGVYKFDASKLGAAHLSCYNRAEHFMKSGFETVIVSNTFTKESEINPYIKLGRKYEYVTFSIVVENRHNGKSVHDVPDVTMSKMKNRFNLSL